MTSDKREKAIKYLTVEIRSLRMAPKINGCGPENWVEQLEIMETCLEAVRSVHFADAGKMQPLTLEQLREMDGQPVWVDFTGSHIERDPGWFILKSILGEEAYLVGAVSVYKALEYYGAKWRAYAYPQAHIDLQAWINVEDRLPEDEKPVLAYYGFYREEDDLGARFIGTLTYFSHDPDPHWQHESTGLFVTHWMPLPEPPDELEKRLRG